VCVCVCYDVSLLYFMSNEVVRPPCSLFDLMLEINYNLWIQLNWKGHFYLLILITIFDICVSLIGHL
jgi:hypothetical protein